MRQSPILDILDNQLVASGIHPDLHELKTPLWVDGENINFRGTKARKIEGWTSAFSTTVTVPIRGLLALRENSGVQKLFFGTTSNLYVWNLATVASVGSGYTGVVDETGTQLATAWSMVPWGDWVVATNGVDVPQIYQGSSFANMTGLTFTRAEIFIKKDTFLIAINTSNGATDVEWCSSDDLTVWSPDANNSAGSLIFREATGPLRAAAPLGGSIGVYTENQLFSLDFVGGNLYFGRRLLLEGIGCVGKMAVVSEGRRNWGVSRDGLWMTDGATYRYVDNPSFNRWLQDNVNWAQGSKINGVYNHKEEQVEFFFPTVSGEPEVGWAVNVKTLIPTKLNYGRTSAYEQGVFEYPIAATSGGNIYYHEFGTSADGGELVALLESRPFTLGSPSAWATVDEYKVMLDELQGSGPSIRFGTQERLDDVVSWGDWQLLDESMDSYFPAHNSISGVYIRFQLRSSGTNTKWAFCGIMLYGAGTGTDVDDSND